MATGLPGGSKSIRGPLLCVANITKQKMSLPASVEGGEFPFSAGVSSLAGTLYDGYAAFIKV